MTFTAPELAKLLLSTNFFSYSTHFLLRDETLQLVFDILNQVMNIMLGKSKVNVYQILWSEENKLPESFHLHSILTYVERVLHVTLIQ